MSDKISECRTVKNYKMICHFCLRVQKEADSLDQATVCSDVSKTRAFVPHWADACHQICQECRAVCGATTDTITGKLSTQIPAEITSVKMKAVKIRQIQSRRTP